MKALASYQVEHFRTCLEPMLPSYGYRLSHNLEGFMQNTLPPPVLPEILSTEEAKDQTPETGICCPTGLLKASH